MICQQCSEKEATVHLTQVVDGQVKKVHLCDTCAADSGFDMDGPVSITDILLGMGGEEPTIPSPEPIDRSCPDCNMSKADFKKSGRLGCPTCYETFTDDLSSLVKALHRSDQHVGKVPAREGMRVKMSAEIARLQKDLNEAVACEQFEDAARIRDQIQSCRAAMRKEKAENRNEAGS
ncbi:MAG: UvrB/UvrC motif-containing protein [Verrucomicrobiota bacterium]